MKLLVRNTALKNARKKAYDHISKLDFRQDNGFFQTIFDAVQLLYEVSSQLKKARTDNSILSIEQFYEKLEFFYATLPTLSLRIFMISQNLAKGRK
jgi:hypothetical protein